MKKKLIVFIVLAITQALMISGCGLEETNQALENVNEALEEANNAVDDFFDSIETEEQTEVQTQTQQTTRPEAVVPDKNAEPVPVIDGYSLTQSLFLYVNDHRDLTPEVFAGIAEASGLYVYSYNLVSEETNQVGRIDVQVTEARTYMERNINSWPRYKFDAESIWIPFSPRSDTKNFQMTWVEMTGPRETSSVKFFVGDNDTGALPYSVNNKNHYSTVNEALNAYIASK